MQRVIKFTLSFIVEGISFDEFKSFLKTEILNIVEAAAFSQEQTKHDTENNQRLYTRAEAAAKLRISLPTLGQFSKDGTIKAHRVGTRVRYTEQSIQEALKEMRVSKHRKR